VIAIDPPVKPVLFADAVIVPAPLGVTRIMAFPSWLVIPLPEAVPVRLTRVSVTAELPAVTVKVTYIGTLIVTALWLDETLRVGWLVDEMVVEPSL
jgi:hypothetical protein